MFPLIQHKISNKKEFIEKFDENRSKVNLNVQSEKFDETNHNIGLTSNHNSVEHKLYPTKLQKHPLQRNKGERTFN